MKKKLLAENRKALQFLHIAERMDFEKPYTVHAGSGRITWGQIQKLIPAGHHAALLAKPAAGPGVSSWRAERLHYIKITASRFEPRTGENGPARMTAYYRGIEWFLSVGDFETARKAGFAVWFLVTQAAEYMTDGRPGAPRDLLGRWRLIDRRTVYNPGTKEHYTSEMTLRTAEGGDAAAWKYEPYRCYTPGTRSADLRAVIDASGYLVEPRRAEQRRKLAALKKAKAAAALTAADFSGLEKRAAAALADTRGTLAGDLLRVETAAGYDAIEKRLRRLRWAAFDLELYEKRKAAGKLESCAAVRETLENIIKKCMEVIKNEKA